MTRHPDIIEAVQWERDLWDFKYLKANAEFIPAIKFSGRIQDFPHVTILNRNMIYEFSMEIFYRIWQEKYI